MLLFISSFRLCLFWIRRMKLRSQRCWSPRTWSSRGTCRWRASWRGPPCCPPSPGTCWGSETACNIWNKVGKSARNSSHSLIKTQTLTCHSNSLENYHCKLMSSDNTLSLCWHTSPHIGCSPDQGPVANLRAAGQHKLEPAVIEAGEVHLLIRILGVRVAGGVIIPEE